jgi:hypothetical protein
MTSHVISPREHINIARAPMIREFPSEIFLKSSLENPQHKRSRYHCTIVDEALFSKQIHYNVVFDVEFRTSLAE